MTRYELMSDRFEFRFRNEHAIPTMTPQEIFDDYRNLTCNAPTLIESFKSLDEAERALASYSGSTSAQAGCPFWVLRGDLYFIEINEYDEDGEFDQGGDICGFVAEGYVSRPAREATYKVRPEFWDEWYADGASIEEYDPDKTITFDEIEWLAGEWEADIFKLLDEVEEV